MAEYLVAGGRPLHGCLTIQGAKNAALPLLAAALLPPESRIARCPRLRDTGAAAGILRSLGCRVRREGDSVLVDARPAGGWEISEGWMREMRSAPRLPPKDRMHTRSPTPSFCRAAARSAKRISSRTGLPVTMGSCRHLRWAAASGTASSTLSAVPATRRVVTPG